MVFPWIGRVWRVIAIAGLQALLVALSVPVAFWLGQRFEFFPREIIPIWTSARPQDVFPTMGFMAGSAFGIFAMSQMLFGPSLPPTSRRTAIEIYAFGVAVAIGSVAMFFLSSAVFDPELLLGIGLVGFCLFWLGHWIVATLSGPEAVSASLVGPIREGVALLLSARTIPLALLALVIMTTPIALAYKFKADRAFADRVTAFRMALLPDRATAARYSTVAAFPDLHFLQPMKLRFDPHDPNRIYVLERAGRLYTFDVRDPVPSKTLLLDLTEEVQQIAFETGAQGFALHPAYRYQHSAGHNDLFVYYTQFNGTGQTNFLSSFDMSAPTPEARRATKRDLIALGGKPNGSHNGGDVHFGPDGFLYFSVGDRISFANLQRIDRSLYGGIFRIDVDMQGGAISFPPKRQPVDARTAGYFIPADNPLVGAAGAIEEFYAWGLRNPFRYSFDREGRIWAGEVGAAKWEEINIIQRGGNYQWPFAEGFETSDTPRPDPVFGTEVAPVYSYVHTASDRAVIGGFVVEDARLEGLNGRYIFGDNFSGNLFAIDGSGARVRMAEVIGRVDQYGQRGLTSFTRAPDGEILITTMGGREEPEGEILKLIVDEGKRPEIPSKAPPEDIPLASAEVGFEHFIENCATCHGSDVVPTMVDQGFDMPDFTDPAYHASRSDAELREILLRGGGRLGVDEAMPPWEGILSKQEITAIILHLRALPDKQG